MVVPNKMLSDSFRVLIVDDNETLAEYYSDLLTFNGCKTTVFNNSLAALSDFELNNYDFVLSDISMPNMNGDELAVEMLKVNPQIPIVLCSGFHPETTVQELLNLGIRDFLPKPIDSSRLLDIINNLKLC
ncbi:MAG: response regulator [Gammaproteobacteria bacterium]|nr:response regulator [Gammaproteobacteria bacterium]